LTPGWADPTINFDTGTVLTGTVLFEIHGLYQNQAAGLF